MKKKVSALETAAAGGEAVKVKAGRKAATPEQKEAAAKARALEKEKAKNMRPEVFVQYQGGEVGVDALVEIGPGKALSGFAKKTVPETPVCAVETAADVEGLAEALRREVEKKDAEREAKLQAAVQKAKGE